jgi:hypothetical protein
VKRVLSWDFHGTGRLPWLVIIFATLLGVVAEDSRGPAFLFKEGAIFKVGREQFNLTTDDGRASFCARAEKFIAEHKTGQRRVKQVLESSESVAAIAQRRRDIRGLAEMVRLAREFPKEQVPEARELMQQEILEIASAIANNHRSPVPSYVGLPDFPFRLAAALSNPVAKGYKPAANVVLGEGTSDLSHADPPQSTYWRRPASISAMDLYAGFGRTQLPCFDNCLWSYAGPKKSGRNAGCELACGSQRIKVKFGETHSEPFISRIFHALGYNVDAADFAPQLRMRYDRRFFRELNPRPEMKMSIGVFFIPIYTFHFEQTYDPFDFIDHAVLKSGKTISGAELKKLVLQSPTRTHGPFEAENFRPEGEAEIEYLVTTAANIQVESSGSHNIGPWDFDGLGREDLRELRGAGVLAAWLGWWDSRYENTRVRLVKTSRGRELRRFFTDLGGGLGLAAGTFRHSSEEPNDFKWSFTCGRAAHRIGKETWHFEITGFEPITETTAFKEITLDDARWMGRLIGQLTEEQIISALIAAGFGSAEVRIYTEKLIARRDQLVRDLQLADELPLLRPHGCNRQITYDPMIEGPVRIQMRTGAEIQAPIGVNVLRNGRVQARSTLERR